FVKKSKAQKEEEDSSVLFPGKRRRSRRESPPVDEDAIEKDLAELDERCQQKRDDGLSYHKANQWRALQKRPLIVKYFFDQELNDFTHKTKEIEQIMHCGHGTVHGALSEARAANPNKTSLRRSTRGQSADESSGSSDDESGSESGSESESESESEEKPQMTI
ncbi:hypothetical protein KIPB_012430, partial [Kipferlia bialata]